MRVLSERGSSCSHCHLTWMLKSRMWHPSKLISSLAPDGVLPLIECWAGVLTPC